MSQLFVFVLQDPNQEQDLVAAWLEHGVPGMTMFDSFGMSHQHTGGTFDDLPLIPSLSSILRAQEDPSMTFLSVLPDDYDVEGLIAASESVVGDLNEPNVGIAFTVPILKAWGLRR